MGARIACLTAILATFVSVGAHAADTRSLTLSIDSAEPLTQLVRQLGWLERDLAAHGYGVRWDSSGSDVDFQVVDGKGAVMARRGGAGLRLVYVLSTDRNGATPATQFLAVTDEFVAAHPASVTHQVLRTIDAVRRWSLAHPVEAARELSATNALSVERAASWLASSDRRASAPGPAQRERLRADESILRAIGPLKTADELTSIVDALIDRATARAALSAMPVVLSGCATFCDQW